MKYQIPPKIAVINSFAGYGRCSMTEALPIISAMRVQACPVPTAIFSNHTGFSSHFGMDFTEQLEEYLAQWTRLGIAFDGIYCGFLGQEGQVLPIASFILEQRKKGCPIVVIDPVMGDHGKTYKTVTPAHCRALKDLVALADIVTPNLTEACLLTQTPYRDANLWEADDLQKLCASLHAMGPKKIAVTGLQGSFGDGGPESFLNFISQQSPSGGPPKTACLHTPSAGPSRHGTGDIFASILAADAVRQRDFYTSVQKAAGFLHTCIQASNALKIPEKDGVCFENFLHMLEDAPNTPLTPASCSHTRE